MAGPRFDVLSRGLTTLTYRGSHCMNSRLPDYLPRLRRVCCVSKILGGLRHKHGDFSTRKPKRRSAARRDLHRDRDQHTPRVFFVFSNVSVFPKYKCRSSFQIERFSSHPNGRPRNCTWEHGSILIHLSNRLHSRVPLRPGNDSATPLDTERSRRL